MQTIMGLQRETRRNRTPLDRLTDIISDVATSPWFIVAHVLWFASWIGSNTIGGAQFDRYPFNLLTLAVSLEAIVLTGFVLMAQARMTQQADKRAHLDLQINLLAEQELTAILKVVCSLAERAGVGVASVEPHIDSLRHRTDVQDLAETIETEMANLETDAEDVPKPDGRPQ